MENNNENKELEQSTVTEVKSENINNEKDKIIKETVKVEKKIVNEVPTKNFFARLLSGVVDQCIVVASSLIIVLIMDGILRLIGYYIEERISIFFLVYVLANIIYPTIMQGTRFRTTFGNKLFK
ncbi:MAG: hypothetical protein ACRCX8_08885 [Sarcina sp.]